MSDRLPVFLTPLSFSDRERVLSGFLMLNAFPRLAGLEGNEGTRVNIKLDFFKEGRRHMLQGELRTVINQQCQNCLAPLASSIESRFKLAFVRSLDEIQFLPDSVEPFLLETEEVALVDLVEDELLLALPAYPKHSERCLDEKLLTNDQNLEKQVQANNPFAALAELKKHGD